MIVGNINELKNFVPDDMSDFVSNLDEQTPLSKYHFNNNNFINVESYLSKALCEAKYETHKKYIDIQLVLSGEENIYIKNTALLEKPCGYDESKDIEFYNDKINSEYITLNNTNFVILYPEDAHAPQVRNSEKSQNIKKAVIKLKVKNQ